MMVAFDTLKFVEKLEAGGFTHQQAKAAAEAFSDATGQELATKADLAGVRAELASTRSELKADIASVRSELKADIASVRSELKADIELAKRDLKIWFGSAMIAA